MAYTYAARQPILDENGDIFGYEILFRDSLDNKFPDVNSDHATNRILAEQFFSTHADIIEGKLAFINFSYNSIINLLPTLLSKDQIVIEVLEDCLPTKELFFAMVKLKNLGYKLALDDFIPSPDWIPFLPYVDIIKFDIRITPANKVKNFIKKISGSKIKFIAEKVETHEEYQNSLEAGFHYFQGYFFSKPEIIKKKRISKSQMTAIELAKEVSRKSIDFKKIESIFSSDVILSYELLKYVNTDKITSSISSFSHALSYLGEDRLRYFISFSIMTNLSSSKPPIINNLSVQRARFCELIALTMDNVIDSESAFLVGLFSLLDVIFDAPMADVVSSIPIDHTIKKALTQNDCALSNLLILAKSYEYGEWNTVDKMAEFMNVETETLRRCFEDAIRWD
ncbi:EAL and HDOD domain-containing protein [Vibrio sp. VB16]|uniref:EAL and HDOD domain-containing protein n=1 Tax=Vibrio sp. VB16 TaxID=2785746 RepID=UPI00189DD003|nr:EAL domain-containing protein [Vibrio sp. VB16]UGA55960.1 EAL domain-containing protein [Vibrio sp. VB16]